ncbi:hypothetical protein GP486_003335 [Trichoglossum hirsutum]|uniref:Uncharacterized protein n=1 Tax=Trichoglossum hirsutum TaxID=265104 RepID=A0A9P8RR91_9PEZI|nr:hypothetical protein GP486_003335 [Trichoglossum hirsutum]
MKGITIPALASLLLSTTVTGLPGFSQSKFNHGKRDYGYKVNWGDFPFPYFDEKLPLFSLGDTVQFPPELLAEIFKTAAPGVEVKNQTVNSSSFFYDGDRLTAFFDKNTGETSVFPRLELLKPAASISGNISRYLKDLRIFPEDDTIPSIVIGSNLLGSRKEKDAVVSNPAIYLKESLIQRSINHGNQRSTVCGPGTKASFSFGSDGAIKALSHRWRSARNLGSALSPMPQDKVRQAITDQLAAANITNATVTSVDLCFYDSGYKYIQPVYRYNATVSHPSGVADNLVVGYIPVSGKAPEALPNLNPPVDQPQPSAAGINPHPTPNNITRRQEAPVTVGRYAMSNDIFSPQIVVDENSLWSGLSLAALIAGGFFSFPEFINSQYYWDEPFIYEANNRQFANGVNFAFTEGHGNVHLFTTNETEPNWGVVNIADIPPTGFGPGSDGALAYWIIRACRTLSTPADYSTADFNQAFDVWWPVFNGLHAVMGYRSDAQVFDNEIGAVGFRIGLGAGVVFAWLEAARGGGKTSAMTVCGHTDDTIFQRQNLGRPGCLQEWWYD